MNPIALCLLAATVAPLLRAAESSPAGNPTDNLPSYLTRITWFGERADWSHDGARILFLSKTFGDAMEMDISSGRIRNLTAHYPHHGYTRALYLQNGDILLSGPQAYNPSRIGEARVQCWLFVLDRSVSKPAVPLLTKCSEGPAVSRQRMHIAWTQVAAQYPEEMARGGSRILEADIVYEQGRPKLVNQSVILRSEQLPFRCTLECQNYVPPGENLLIFSAYGHQGTDVCLIDLRTKKVTNLTDSPPEYDEPEGIFPDGKHTLVECDKQNRKGSGYVDLWKLALDGSKEYVRLTHFSDFPGYKASNAVISDDGKFMAFQLAKSAEAAGVGHGIFIYDFAKAAQQGHR